MSQEVKLFRGNAPDILAAKTSRQVGTVIAEWAGGRIKLFGEPHPNDPRFSANTAQRTEIEMPTSLVVVHKNFHETIGRRTPLAILNEIEVQNGEVSHSLRVQPYPETDIYANYYEFFDGDLQLSGNGKGRFIDRRLAQELTGVRSLWWGESVTVPDSVVQWVRDQLSLTLPTSKPVKY